MPRKLRNAGPNGDSAADLLSDAIGMLEEIGALCHNPAGINAGAAMAIATNIEDVIRVLRELEAD